MESSKELNVKPIKGVNERLKERAVRKLGVFLGVGKIGPTNEVIRGEEDRWKIPGKPTFTMQGRASLK